MNFASRSVLFGVKSAPRSARFALPLAAVKEVPVELQAFEVKADASDSYEVLNTSGVTGTNRSIRSLPITMNVFTRPFSDELGATDISGPSSSRPTFPGCSTAPAAAGSTICVSRKSE